MSTNTSKPSSPVYPVRATSAADTGHAAFGDGVVAQTVQGDVGQRSQHGGSQRSLDGHERGRQGAVVEDGAAAGQPFGQRIADGRGVGGVGDDQEPLGTEAVDDQVVDDAAVGCADHRILGPAYRQRRRIADQRISEPGARFFALDEELAHVGEIEQAGPGTHRSMLVEDAGVLDRHQPAGELHHLRAEGDVAIGQRRREKGLMGLGHRASTSGYASLAGRALQFRESAGRQGNEAALGLER